MEDRKMRILMTTDSLGGVWTYCTDLCSQLTSLGVEIHLAILGKEPDPGQVKWLGNQPDITFYSSNYKLEWMDKPWDDLEKSTRWLEHLQGEIQPDIIHFNSYGHGIRNVSWNCPVITVFHSCVLSWRKAVTGAEVSQNEQKKYRKIVKNALRVSDVVIAPSKTILAEAENLYGKFDNSRCIYNGCSGYHHKPDPYRPFIFSSGRIWDRGKNLKVLDEVATALDWPVYIAGDNKDPLTGELTYLNYTHFLGRLRPESVREWMVRASLYISPAKYEPFGLSVLEAARAGCPLLLSDIPTFRELWNGAACFFDPDSPRDIVKKVRMVTSNTLLMNKLGEAAEKRARLYNASAMASEYLQVYRQLLQKDNISYHIQKSIV